MEQDQQDRQALREWCDEFSDQCSENLSVTPQCVRVGRDCALNALLAGGRITQCLVGIAWTPDPPKQLPG